MKNKLLNSLLKLLSLSIFFVCLNANAAQPILTCAHPEICELAKTVLAPEQVKYNSVVFISGDPHEYEPDPKTIKELISAEFLISGPNELNPWIKKINYQRSKGAPNPNSKSLSLTLTKDELEMYSVKDYEAVSHFWLYPRIYCQVQSGLETELRTLHFKTIKNSHCMKEAQGIESLIKESLKTINIPMILTHNALYPLLSSLSSNHLMITSLKGSGHHEDSTPMAIKKLYDTLKSPKTIWIEELGINIPSNIMSKKRKEDITISLETAKSAPTQLFGTLHSLVRQLKTVPTK